MLDRAKAEPFWLGAEALPAGLKEINETIEAWVAAGSHRQFHLHSASRPEGVISMAARWMRDVTRPG